MTFNFDPLRFNAKEIFSSRVDSLNKSFEKGLGLALACSSVELDDKVVQSIKDVISDESNKLRTIHAELMNKIERILGASIK